MSHARRVVSLLGSVLVALSAGSTYVFSSYAPQLQEVLHLSSTQLNVLGLAGNFGLYISGPLWGSWVDRHGPHSPIVIGSVCVLLGYGLLAYAYMTEAKEMPVMFLALFQLLTGLGNSAGLSASMNAQAKSWGGDQRGTAMALVLAGFGLSAFLYSTVSHLFFPGDVGGYLLALSLGGFASFTVGAALIRIVPPTYHVHTVPRSGRRGGYSALPTDEGDEEGDQAPPTRPPMRPRASSEASGRAYAWIHRRTGDVEGDEADDDVEDMYDDPSAREQDVTGFALLRNPDFLLLFVLITLVSGAGLLLINNVGTITTVLWDYNERMRHSPHRHMAEAMRKSGKHAVQQSQAKQVSLISIGNAVGRLAIGAFSDFLVYWTQEPTVRTPLLLLVTLLALCSQLLAAVPGVVTTVKSLYGVSLATGLMYGSLFGICPVLVFEWFGMHEFSQNWGWMSLSPVVAGNVFNILFGMVYDANVSKHSHTHTCHKGPACYQPVFRATSAGCCVAILLSIILVVRHARGIAARPIECVQALISRVRRGLSC